MIAVVGAGPAGLATAAMLRQAGEDVVVLERGKVAEAWTTRYDRLHLHTVRWLSGLPGYRIPRAYGKWPARDRVVDYLRGYADRNRLAVRTCVEVERLDRADGAWAIATSDGVVEAERVVVATGHSNVPFVPDWADAFAGELVHSSDYRNPAPYEGKRVLVVGAGNSGAEIAVDVADGGASAVWLSVRTPPAIVRRDTLGIPSQLFGLATGHLPVGAVDRIAATMRRVSVPDLGPYGLPAPPRPYTEFLRRQVIPILDVGIVDAVRGSRVHVVGALEGFDEGEAVLGDGTRIDPDVVVAATGYRPGLERLVGHLGVLDERGDPVVHGSEEHPDAPGLHFVGYSVTLGGAFRMAGIEAKQLARHVAAGRRGQAPTPVVA